MSADLDFETYSEADITAVGAIRYAEHHSTRILIVGFALSADGPVKTVNMEDEDALEQLQPLFEYIEQGGVVVAHNSQFERAIWELVGVPRHGFPVAPKSRQWDCTAARAAAIAIPRSLAGSSTALGLAVNKDPKGMALIQKFSKPGKNGVRTYPNDDPASFEEFMRYCDQDVVVERELNQILPPLTPFEKKVFALDYRINLRGIPVDIPSIKKALQFIEERSTALTDKAVALTGLRPTQRDKLLAWLQEKGVEIKTLQAAEVEQTADTPGLDPEIRELLKSRIELARAGTKKLKTMLVCASEDERVRGSFWYHSATTGRWGSGGVQFHNLGKADQDFDHDEFFELLHQDALELFYDQPLSVVAKAVRGFVKAPEGKEFLIADYSSIEARGLAWLADEKWLVEDFRNGIDAYKSMASRIYHKPYNDIDSHLRFFGKQVVLGAGYGMGPPRFMEQCKQYGKPLRLTEAKHVIKAYRESVPNITKLWKMIELAARKAILNPGPVRFAKGKLTFQMEKLSNGFKVLFLTLPSGRRIAYPQPRVEMREKWGNLQPTIIFKTYYRGMWVDEETYGGKLTENAVQAISRDFLAEGMLNIERAGLPVVLHVHDESGSEVPAGSGTVEGYEDLLCQVRPWAKDFPLSADGFRTVRYQKPS